MATRAPRRRRDGFILNLTATEDTVTLTGEGLMFTDVVPLVRDWLAAQCGCCFHRATLRQLTAQLVEATHDLNTAMVQVGADPTIIRKRVAMAAADTIAELTTEVANAKTVMASAAVLIRGISGRIDAAVQEALANGATAEQLAPITDAVTALREGETDLGGAISENTPAA